MAKMATVPSIAHTPTVMVMTFTPRGRNRRTAGGDYRLTLAASIQATSGAVYGRNSPRDAPSATPPS